MATGLKVRFICPAGQWYRAQDDWQKIIARAATAAVKQVSIKARDAARSSIGASGFGGQWQKSIVASMHPKRGDVLNPWAWVHSTLNFSDVFETGKTVSGAPFLWIPLPAVPRYPGTGSGKFPPRQMTPKKYIELCAPLRSIKRPGKPPMLGAVVSVGGTGKITHQSSWMAKNKRSARQTQRIIPLFVGVPRAVIQKRFDVMPAIQREAEKLEQAYLENIAAAGENQ